MDKYEYKLKLDQMKALAAEGDYANAAEIADSINWRKVRNINLLIKAGDIYTKQGRYDDARDILLMAYDRSPIGRMIIYRLAEIAVKMKNFEEAEEYYDEFVEIAPHDNLKYVLRYKISKARGTDIKTQIMILEEFKDVEYTEEWAYELAYLYHQAGESDKCIEACDELILWFGEGIYVERALELKMLYQPLSKSQEDKYRSFKQRRDGVKEVYPHNESTVTIPVVSENVEKYNTINLQEEIAKGMQQIREATDKEFVEDTMDTLKKLAVPFLPEDYSSEEVQEKFSHIRTDEEIDNSLRINFHELFSEEHDGQISLMVNGTAKERQITGQISIQEVLDEWEKKQLAAQQAMELARQEKLESAKARALQEAGDIMERLADVIPKFEEGVPPAQILREEYLSKGNLANEEGAGRFFEGINTMMQQEIDRLTEEAETENDLLRKIKLAKPNFDEQIGLKPYVPQQFEDSQLVEELPEIADPFAMEGMPEQSQSEYMPEAPIEEAYVAEQEMYNDSQLEEYAAETAYEGMSEEELSEEMRIAEAEFFGRTVEDSAEELLPEESFGMESEPEDASAVIIKQDTKEIKTKKISAALEDQIKQFQREEDTAKEDITKDDIVKDDTVKEAGLVITKLNEKQRNIFTYFVPVAGMEQQICQVLTGASAKLLGDNQGAAGNILIQGGRGCGKTVLATGIIKALQSEIKRPNGKIGKIDAKALNKKDISEVLKKIAGGCLIIERAGDIDRETAVKLSLLLETDTSGILIIMEDTRTGLNQALGRDEGLARKFTEKIAIPVFTSDELVEFGKAYAKDLKYEIDNMGVLALYNRISNIQRLDRATTLTEVKEIVDEAIERAEKKGLKKAISIITSRRYSENDYVILREKDFEE